MSPPDFLLTAVLELLKDGSVQESFQLRIERVVHSIGRNPVIFAVPGVQDPPESGIPRVFALDFGMMTENIILSGVLPDDDPLGREAAVFPTHKELANFVRTWWRFAFEASGVSFTNANRLRLREGQGPPEVWYGILIQGLQCERVGGATHWNFKLTLAVVDFPERLQED